jgi:antitoxin MazE
MTRKTPPGFLIADPREGFASWDRFVPYGSFTFEFDLHQHPKIYISKIYPKEAIMQVSKWGNSLAIRLPATVVNALNLNEGDDIEVIVADDRVFKIRKKPGKAVYLARLRKYRGKLPADFIFDRDDANARK